MVTSRGPESLAKRFVLIVLLGGAISTTVLLFACWAMNVPGWYRMAHHPGIATGVVISKHPEDREKVGYTFSAAERTYSGRGAVGDDFSRINAGDAVQVVYDPQDPNLSILMGSPPDIYKQAFLVSLVFSLLTGFPTAFLALRSFGKFK